MGPTKEKKIGRLVSIFDVLSRPSVGDLVFVSPGDGVGGGVGDVVRSPSESAGGVNCDYKLFTVVIRVKLNKLDKRCTTEYTNKL